MRTLMRTLLICLLAQAAVALAQEDSPKATVAPQENPLSANNKLFYGYLKMILLRSADKMPEENYNFKPTFVVRSFGHVIGHVADSQYTFCSAVLGEKNPLLRIERTKTSKADLIAALKDSFAYCDKAYDGMTDASAVQMVNVFGGMPKLGVLTANNIHTVEHYGNLIIYMRLKNLVPPTSEPEFLQQPKK
ncbi:MAG TPA: DinB family protein [Blastocatellia bacterium]|nr:DinB family protein [Blastocatellia bacterium]